MGSVCFKNARKPKVRDALASKIFCQEAEHSLSRVTGQQIAREGKKKGEQKAGG